MHDVLRSLLSASVKESVARTEVAEASVRSSTSTDTKKQDDALDGVIVYGKRSSSCRDEGAMAKRVKIETEEDSELRRRLSQPPTSLTRGSQPPRTSSTNNLVASKQATSAQTTSSGLPCPTPTILPQCSIPTVPHGFNALKNPLLSGLLNVDSLCASLRPDVNQILLAMLQQSLQTIVSMQTMTQNTTSHTMWDTTQQTPIKHICVTQGSKHTPEKNDASLGDDEDPISKAKRLTTPKISKSHHNDAAYYPNIQCILCKEWVCSRNRFMHVESHLQYRPYKCSVCGYDNRKEIFINLHIKKAHGGYAEVVYQPDADLEHRAWVISENCIQHTREVLSKGIRPDNGIQANGIDALDGPSDVQSPAASKEVQSELVDPLRYRPRIFNSQRAEKTQIIEESRVKGLIPDFSEISSRETKCELCDVHVLSSGPIMEEHSRVHLSKASYRCSFDGCDIAHNSKSFLTRHMKEVHKNRKYPIDRMRTEIDLKMEFDMVSVQCFPQLAAKGRKRATPPPPANQESTTVQQRPNDATGDAPTHRIPSCVEASPCLSAALFSSCKPTASKLASTPPRDHSVLSSLLFGPQHQ